MREEHFITNHFAKHVDWSKRVANYINDKLLDKNYTLDKVDKTIVRKLKIPSVLRVRNQRVPNEEE